MTWTFSEALATDKDKVRFLVSDTQTTEQLVSDEGINLMLAEHGNKYLAAAAIAEIIGGNFASEESFSVKGITISDGSSRGSQYRALAIRLRAQAATAASGGGGIGGAFVGVDSNGLTPVFSVGQHDFN
jgi:hypothetical protein